MTEISLHILDIVQNSIKAEATLVTVEIVEDTHENILDVTISDNGHGMDKDFLKDVINPFKTSRTTRKVGMGLSLFENAAKMTGGSFSVDSQVGKGTVVKARFVYNHIDRQPVGDTAATFVSLISLNENVDFVYKHTFNHHSFEFSTKNIKDILGSEVSIKEPDVLKWINDFINEGLDEIHCDNKI